jgi:RNA-directed DNA polymerase
MTTPEPKDKLDAVATPVAVVNGPEDDIVDWAAIDWRVVDEHVRRLRQQIFTRLA